MKMETSLHWSLLGILFDRATACFEIGFGISCVTILLARLVGSSVFVKAEFFNAPKRRAHLLLAEPGIHVDAQSLCQMAACDGPAGLVSVSEPGLEIITNASLDEIVDSQIC